MASKDRWQARTKRDSFGYLPEDFFVINAARNAEWKAAKGTNHPLYDPRADEAAAHPSRKIISGIKQYRWVASVPVFRQEWLDGEDVIIPIDGRNRVEGTAVANAEFAAEIAAGTRDDTKENGPVMIPADPFTGPIEAARAIMLVSGIKRRTNPLRDAQQCRDFQLATGAGNDVAAITFGCSAAKIVMGQQLLECVEEIQQKVADGGLSLNVVIKEKVYEMAPRDQRDFAARLDASGATRGEAAREAARETASEATKPGSTRRNSQTPAAGGSDKTKTVAVSRRSYPVIAAALTKAGAEDLAALVSWLGDMSSPLPLDLAEALSAVVADDGMPKPAPKPEKAPGAPRKPRKTKAASEEAAQEAS